MRKITALMLSLLLTVSLAACSSSASNEEASQGAGSTAEEASKTEPSQTGVDEGISGTDEDSSAAEESSERNILIAYFTYGENAGLSSDADASSSASIQVFNGEVTGNTGVMAHMIAESSGGSAFSDAIDEIKDMEPDATVLDGLHISGSSVNNAKDSVDEWVNGLGLSK